MAEYIDREAAIHEFKTIGNIFVYGRELCEAIISTIDSIPAADVRPVVRGTWEEVEVTWLADIEDQPDAIASMFCPKCRRFANHVYHYGDPTHGMNFCPNCGAEMEES